MVNHASLFLPCSLIYAEKLVLIGSKGIDLPICGWSITQYVKFSFLKFFIISSLFHEECLNSMTIWYELKISASCEIYNAEVELYEKEYGNWINIHPSLFSLCRIWSTDSTDLILFLSYFLIWVKSWWSFIVNKKSFLSWVLRTQPSAIFGEI